MSGATPCVTSERTEERCALVKMCSKSHTAHSSPAPSFSCSVRLKGTRDTGVLSSEAMWFTSNSTVQCAPSAARAASLSPDRAYRRVASAALQQNRHRSHELVPRFASERITDPHDEDAGQGKSGRHVASCFIVQRGKQRAGRGLMQLARSAQSLRALLRTLPVTLKVERRVDCVRDVERAEVVVRVVPLLTSDSFPRQRVRDC
eukprot:scaffold595_cov72-Phaeocystis_antarctica.AAC.2